MKDQELIHGLPAKEVLSRARRARKMMGHSTRALLFWLAEVERRMLYRQWGFSSTFAFAENELELDGHTVAEMLRTSRSLQGLPLLLEAADEIAPSKLREISRVCSVETQGFWIDAARSQPCRTVEKLVAITRKGELPPVGGVEKTPGAGCEIQADINSDRHRWVDTPDLWMAVTTGDKGSESRIQPEFCAPTWDSKTSESTVCRGHGWGSGIAGATAPKLRHKFIVELEADEYAILEAALRRAAKECGRRNRASALRHLAESFLNRQFVSAHSTKPEVGVVSSETATEVVSTVVKETSTGPVTPDQEWKTENNQIGKPACSLDSSLSPGPTWDRRGEYYESRSPNQNPTPDTASPPARTPSAPFRLVIHTAPAHGISWMESPTGIRLVSKEKVEEAACCGEILDLRDRESQRQSKPRTADLPLKHRKEEKAGTTLSGDESQPGPVGKKVKAAAKPPAGPRMKSAIPPSVRRMVFSRDGGRCSVPGCCNHAWQHQHHIRPRSENGSNDPSNLVLVCSSCHGLIHEGKLEVEGSAPDGLVWRNALGRVMRGSAWAA